MSYKKATTAVVHRY